MLNNHIIPGCPYVKELEWHTSPVEALTAFGYVKMEFFGLRFSAFYYGLITRLYYIYGIFSKMFYPKSTFYTFRVPS